MYSIHIKIKELDHCYNALLTTLSYTRVSQLRKKYPLLKRWRFDNEDENDSNIVYIILGAEAVAKIKSSGFIAAKPRRTRKDPAWLHLYKK